MIDEKEKTKRQNNLYPWALGLRNYYNNNQKIN